jgi:uncharacterized SAM-binding protein YcdF (DUF218 family)
MRLQLSTFISQMASPSAKAARFSSRLPTKRPKRRVPILGVLTLLLLGGIGYRQVHAYIQEPQAILVLGGAVEREVFAAEFAQQHPDLEIWVSSGSNPEFARWAFAEAGIASERVHLDYRAVDTVTNFTTLVDDFEALGITSIYLVTSDYHMRRAQVIGEIVLGSRGISYKPIEVPSERSPETLEKAMRDAARAILWVTTGHTGSELHKYFPTRAQSK